MTIRWTGEAQIGHPYWWDPEPDTQLDSALPDRAGILIIGAGYTGLSAAMTAHDCGAKVVVVDADQPGKGASTRNGGMFGAHPRLNWDELSVKFGADTADGVFAEAAPALEWAKGLIEKENIDCDLQNTGRLQLAWTASHLETQKRLARHVTEKTKVRVKVLDRDEIGKDIITERYFGGLVFPEHCALHPAKYHRGLLDAVLKRGIPVVADCAITKLDRDGSGFIATSQHGTIRADKVILATNGYTRAPFRWHLQRVFALPSYIIATEPLPTDLIDQLAPGRRMMVESRARHSYFRVSPDGTRFLYGGRAAMVQMDLKTAAARLHQTMVEVWPELKDIGLSHVWCGNTGYSFNHTPNVGENRGLHHAMGFSGSGTVMAPYLGAKAAYQAVGDPSGQTAYSNTGLTRNLLHPTTTPHFLHAANLWYRSWVDWSEYRKSR